MSRSIPTDAIGQLHPRAGDDARIVSLVPSITELLFALDLGARVVGRTGFCIHPRESVRGVPKLGGTKDVDLAGLIAMRPTHVVVNIDENRRETFDAIKEFVPHVIVTHPNVPRDNLELYRLLGAIFAREREADTLRVAFEKRYAELSELRRSLPPRKVLYLIWREPWMTVSPDTYIANMLKLINWHVQPVTTGNRYPQLTDDALRTSGTDLCLLSSEPYPFRARHVAEVNTLTAGADTQLVDGEMLSWYGNRAISGLAYLTDLATNIMEPAS